MVGTRGTEEPITQCGQDQLPVCHIWVLNDEVVLSEGGETMGPQVPGKEEGSTGPDLAASTLSPEH